MTMIANRFPKRGETQEEAQERKGWQGILDGLAKGTLVPRHSFEGMGKVLGFSSLSVERRESGHILYPTLRIEFGAPRYRTLIVTLRSPLLTFEQK